LPVYYSDEKRRGVMINTSTIKVMVVEDEDFDVSRVKNTVNLSSTKIQIESVLSNGRAALEELQQKPDNYDVIILDYQISGGLRG
jgi:YesN/AraC family two-component response regulator